MPARPLRARIGHLPSMSPPRFELLRAQPADQEIDTSHLAAGAPGTFTNATGTDFCANCEAGTYQSSKAGTACVDCPAGSACEAGSSAPIACPAGTWSSTPRLGTSDGCITCPVGAYCPAGAVLPLLCQAGTHGGGQTGLSDPLCAGSCPSDQIDGVRPPPVTTANGPVATTARHCRHRLYPRRRPACDPAHLTGPACVRCPDHTQCPAAAVTLELLWDFECDGIAELANLTFTAEWAAGSAQPGGGDALLKLWELPSLRPAAAQLPRDRMHSGAVYAAALCAGDKLATASQDAI